MQNNVSFRRGAVKWRPGLLFLLFSCISSLTACTAPSRLHLRAHTPTEHATATAQAIQTQVQAQQRKAQDVLQKMTLEEKLGQVLMVEYVGNDYQNSGLQTMITQYHVGGYLYQPINNNFAPPNDTLAAANAFTAQTQMDAHIPLLVAIDQEGGLVSKVASFFGPAPGAAEMAATGDPTAAATQGTQAAQWLGELGINVDFAPVVDVQTISPPQTPLLRDRTFGTDPQTVTTYAGAFLHSLQTNSVMGTLKHFPGLGSLTAAQDPHDGLYSINRSLAELQKTDLAPYQQLISQEHPAMIMATDIMVPAIDPTLPAELSPKVINGTLRHDLGYQGVVITDGLYMQGITATWTVAQATVLALKAGVDMIEGPYTAQQVANVVTALKAALQSGQLTMARIDEAVQRILLMKIQYGVIK